MNRRLESSDQIAQATSVAPPATIESAKARILEFVSRYGTDFARVLGIGSDVSTVKDPSRRRFLGQTLATAGLVMTPGIAMAEGVHEGVDEMDQSDLDLVVQDFSEHPEVYAKDPMWLDIFISLNFFDVVYSLARKEDSEILGKEVGKASFSNLLLQGVTKLTGLNSKAWGGELSDYVKDFDHEFPHTNVVIGLGLNLYRMSYSEEAKREVLHGFEESAVGVALLLFLTSLGRGIQTSEEKFIASIREGDQFLAESTEQTLERSAVENMDQLSSTIAEVIGAAPMAAALSQLPLTAFGNAQVARDKMLTSLELSNKLFEQLILIPAANREERVQAIKNSVVRNIVLKYGKDLAEIDEADTKEMAKIYMEGIGVGMLSGMMDVTQAAFGDAGPSIVGAYQSFGASEMLKTAFSNALYTYVMGLVETASMARRVGVPIQDMLNKKTIGEARTFANRSLQNVTAYLRGIDGVPEGARFGVGTRLGDDFGSMLRMVIQSADHAFSVVPGAILDAYKGEEGTTPPCDKILTRKVMHILDEFFDKRDDFLVEVATGGVEDTEGGPISADAALRRANWVATGLMSRENARNGAHPHVDAEGQMSYEGEHGLDVDRVMREIEVLVEHSDLGLNERRVQLMERLEHFHHLLSESRFENKRTGDYTTERIHELVHILEKDPSMMDLFRIEYWEQHLGPELAETAFVVFAQGIHIVGLTPSISKLTYEQSDDMGAVWDEHVGPLVGGSARVKEDSALLGSMTMHAALSSVADNWADEIIHSKQLPRELFFPGLSLEFGLDLDELALDYTQNATLQFTQFVVNAEAYWANNAQGVPEGFYERVYDRFLITKFMSILSAVFGGGESMIGNSPHFSAIVKELKEVVTLGGSFKDVYKHFGKHATRLGITFAFARYIGPSIEGQIFGKIFGNPFHPDHRDEYHAPAPGAH